MIIDNFPKTRPELPDAYRRIYLQHLRDNREGRTRATSLSSRLEGWLHRQVAADVKGREANSAVGETLEIGAGTLNHLPYEPSASPYDIVEPCKELYQPSPWLPRIRNVFADIKEIGEALRYDRIISIAAFEHIPDLPEVVAAAALKLRQGGCLRAAIPNEGTILWKLGTLVTGREFKKKYGLDYRILMQYEHINSAREIEAVLRYFFRELECRVFGLSKALAFYRFYDCRGPEQGSARRYLGRDKEG